MFCRPHCAYVVAWPYLKSGEVLFPCSACDESGHPIRVTGPPPTSGDIGWTPENFARIDAVVARVVAELGGDPHRIFLTGVSYGGRGVWDYAEARPSMFAALVPVCASSGPTPAAAASLCCAWLSAKMQFYT